MKTKIKNKKSEEKKEEFSILALRGRSFQGRVIKKFNDRVTIFFQRLFFVPKYERYEKRKSVLHARLLPNLKDSIKIGDLVEIRECRPISKTIHFVVTKKLKEENEGSNS
ncbi:MAG: 30S ribosomal protein S17 [Candidatus Pacearchaeota archaeon]